MQRFTFGALALSVLVTAAPATAAVNCDTGYKRFMERISPTIPNAADADLGILMRRALSVYDACAAGDMFEPTGIWEQIAMDLESTAHKK